MVVGGAGLATTLLATTLLATTLLATTLLATTFFATTFFATTFAATTLVALATTRFAAILFAGTVFATARFGTACLAGALFGAGFLAAAARRRVEATFFPGRPAAAPRIAGRRFTAVRVAWRLTFRGAFARGLAVFVDFLALAGADARLGRPGVRPVVRLAFALAMTLLVCSPLPQEGTGRKQCDVVRLV